MSAQSLKRKDYLLVLAYCLVLYTLVLGVGGPLTMHEGVLSQTSRHMLADHDWAIPHFGSAPWLERPPLPQWLTVGLAQLIGRCDEEWIVRIGPALSGTATVLMTVWLAGNFFGRALGVLSGLILATMYQFVRYATLAEADMFLCPIVAGCMCLFARMSVGGPATSSSATTTPQPLIKELLTFFGKRPWSMLAFFILLGMTNLAKGLVFGTAMTLVPVGGFLLLNADIRAILRYVWLWGWLAFAAVAVAWPIAVYFRYPDALEVWHFDLFARLQGHYLEEPAWYYFGHWFWVVLPWPVAALLGMKLTANQAFNQRYSPPRFLWCWAILTPTVFSFAHGKHVHYMIHFMAPWGILAAHGMHWAWKQAQSWPGWVRHPLVLPVFFGALGDLVLIILRTNGIQLPGPTWFTPILLVVWPLTISALWLLAWHARGRVAMIGSFSLLLALYWLGFTYKGKCLHRSNDDTAFLTQAFTMVPDDSPLLIHAANEALEGLRILFYCPDRTILLHNLTFLHDDRLTAPNVYLIARGRELPNLYKFGQPSLLLQSKKSRREESPADRWALFQIRLRENLSHQSAQVRISPMQAMYRAEGPNLE